MKTERLELENGGHRIPALLWGEGERVLLAVHGNFSHKEDTIIQIVAEHAAERGFQTLSFDLPMHGERRGDQAVPCDPPNGAADLLAAARFAHSKGKEISLFACSLGAYLSLLALREADLHAALLLSPVVSMRRVIENMMAAAGVSEERLCAERVIPVPGGPDLEWEYYCYVKEHPVAGWRTPTQILWGAHDTLCGRDEVFAFAEQYGAGVTVAQEAGHFFHTPEELYVFQDWLDRRLL